MRSRPFEHVDFNSRLGSEACVLASPVRASMQVSQLGVCTCVKNLPVTRPCRRVVVDPGCAFASLFGSLPFSRTFNRPPTCKKKSCVVTSSCVASLNILRYFWLLKDIFKHLRSRSLMSAAHWHFHFHCLRRRHAGAAVHLRRRTREAALARWSCRE